MHVYAFQCCLIPEFGVIHIFLKLCDIVEGLFSQFFGGLDDQRFGSVGCCLHLVHFDTAYKNRAEENFYWCNDNKEQMLDADQAFTDLILYFELFSLT